MNGPSDPLLDSLVGGGTEDSAMIDISFITSCTMVYFNFVFASDEYPGFVGDAYNYVCGIFLDGVNYAHLANIISIDQQPVPGGLSGPISLNNVFTNPGLFIDNQKADNSFSAMGVSKTFRIGIPVTPNTPHTLHLSVADRADPYYDSWILVNGLSGEAKPSVPPTPLPTSTRILNIRTQEKAQQTLPRIDEAMVRKDNIRARLGAMQNRLENTVTSLSIQAENLQASESQISDVDVATEMTEFVRSRILAQASAAMLSQANTLPRMLAGVLDR